MSLQFRTRGESSSQGKPKVYFCCHPADFALYFEPICEDILRISNCAIFWNDGEPEDDWELELGQMQLFVLPVTDKLLSTANRALNVEFRFAIEQHIPVLPLMQESGLERLFNEKCGDLQFLDKNASDPTAISYDDKLKKYLESVLIGDETAAQIRNAFDAYIFLSYRKKDRRHARELMRLIHENDFCRDIAIWYDEFLTPGENFNHSIQEALEKSELFALAVTPNLVNEKNYVMTTEFPMARDNNKRILPAVLVQTDVNELQKKYPGIPACTDAYDGKALADALLTAVQGIAIRENDSDPRHNFLIGLAYLGGVDVEVDHDKAVKLITEAAEAGLIDALRKIASMYRDGEAVERSVAKSITWQERLEQACEEAFRQVGTVEAAGNWLDSMMALGTLYQEAGNWNAAKVQFEKVIVCCKKMARPNIFSWQGRALRKHTSRYPYAMLLQIEANFQIGWCLFALKDLDAAYDRFDDTNDDWMDYEMDVSPDQRAVIGQARSYIGIGDMEIADFGHERAKKEYLCALQILQRLEQQEKTQEISALLAECQEKLSAVCIKTGALDEAKAYSTAAFEVCRRMFAEDQTAQTVSAMARAHITEADVLLAMGNNSSAQEHYGQAQELLLSPQASVCRRTNELLISAHSGLGAAARAAGDMNNAVKHYEKACTIGRESRIPVEECHRALEQIYRERGELAAEKQHAGTHNGGKPDIKLMEFHWSLMARDLYSLYCWVESGCSRMGQRKKPPALPRKLEQSVGSDEVTQQIRCWMETVLPMADEVMPQTRDLQRRVDECRTLELLADRLYEMASAFPLKQGRIFRELACKSYELIYKYCPFTEYAQRAEQIRLDLKNNTE